ncbi:MAG: tryptophan synthase subunit alpha [Candidatus Eremiobacteraeota bacterium]|nr:tryptophan synthase subunit alpha [Candidatus Eremiobacteraeota bacterium]
MSRRVDAAFARAKRARRAAFIPYLMAGDPDLATTEMLLDALSGAGADLIELGVPYGDPLADGPSIASAGTRALAGGTRLRDALALAGRCAARCPPLLIFTYFNPVDRFGIRAFAREAAVAGVAGAIVPDVALEESEELRDTLRAEGLAMPLLVAPSTPRERAARIAAASSGFVYVVSRLGVTGAAAAPRFEALSVQLAMLRELTQAPLAVGFGLHRAEDVQRVATMADGVVVGSALVDAYAGSRGAEAARRVTEFVAPLIAAASA